MFCKQLMLLVSVPNLDPFWTSLLKVGLSFLNLLIYFLAFKKQVAQAKEAKAATNSNNNSENQANPASENEIDAEDDVSYRVLQTSFNPPF